ncbi:MAG: hypothetical protein M0035_12580 [Actinomycetota bacterium]|nr:hypothetical protein [Actinomycetota bacterium]
MGPETNVVSALVVLAVRLTAQQLLEAEQVDFSGGGAATSDKGRARGIAQG